jgi:uncharacterized iron-regulated protein
MHGRVIIPAPAARPSPAALTLWTALPLWAALAVLAATPAAPAAGQDGAAVMDTAYVPGEFRIFTGAGEATALEEVVAAMGRHQVVFIGETHDDPTAHMLQAQLLERAWTAYGAGATAGDASRRVALSLEFFERDVQPIVDEYLADLITEAAFLRDSRPWPRYATDYRPMVEFAKAHGLEVIAANAPRRYVNRATRLGRESLHDLPPHARAILPPLPYGEPTAAYREQWIQVISRVMEQEGLKCGIPVAHAPAPVGAHGNMGNQFHSQVLWDASMAWWVSRYLADHPDALVLHMAGGFHVARGTGTPEQLEAYRPGTRAMIVMIRPVEDVAVFQPAPDGEWGDFVIQTDRARTLESIECREFIEAHRARDQP